MKTKELIKVLREDGWFEIHVGKGSHRNFKHPVKPGKVTVAYYGSGDIPKGTLNSIKKQAGWK